MPISYHISSHPPSSFFSMHPIRLSTTNLPKAKANQEKAQIPYSLCFTPITSENIYNYQLEKCSVCGHYLTPNLNNSTIETKCEFCNSIVSPKCQIPNICEWQINSEIQPKTIFLIDSSSTSTNNNFFSTVLSAIESSYPKNCKNVSFIAISDQLTFLLPNSKIGVITDLEDAVIPPSAFLPSFPETLDPLLKVPKTDKGPDIYSALEIISKQIGQGGHIFLFLSYPPTGKVTFSKVSIEAENVSLRGPNYTESFDVITKRLDRQSAYIDIFIDSLVSRLIDCATFGKIASYLGGRLHYSNPTSNWCLKSQIESFISCFDAVCSISINHGIKILPSLGEHPHHPTSFKLVAPQSHIFPLILPEKISSDHITVQSITKYKRQDGTFFERVCSYSFNVTEDNSLIFKGADCNVILKYVASTLLFLFFNQNSTLRQMESNALGLLKPIFFSFRYHISRNPNRFANLVMPSSIQLLPKLVHGLLKSTAFIPGISFDERASQMTRLCMMSPEEIYNVGLPNMFELSNYLNNIHVTHLELTKLKLSEGEMKDNRFLLLYDGFNTFLWIGEKLNSDLCKKVFGLPSAYSLNSVNLIDTDESRTLFSLFKGNVRFFYGSRAGYNLFTDRLIDDTYSIWLEKIHKVSLPKEGQ